MTTPFYSRSRGFFNSDFQTRSLIGGNDVGTSIFTDVEEKLIRLGLDRAATENETAICGAKLLASLRRRDVSAERIIQSFARATHAARELASARGYVVLFGKHKGKTVGELPRDYIVWALANCDNLSFNLRRAMELVLNSSGPCK